MSEAQKSTFKSFIISQKSKKKSDFLTFIQNELGWTNGEKLSHFGCCLPMTALTSENWKVFRSFITSLEHRGKIPSSPPNRPTHKGQFWTHLVVLTELRPGTCSLFDFRLLRLPFRRLLKSITPSGGPQWRFYIFQSISPSGQSVHRPLVIAPNSWWPQSATQCRGRIRTYPIWTPITPTNVMLC